MTEVSLNLPEVNLPDKTQDPKIVTAFTTLQAWANGNVDSGNFPKALSTTTLAAAPTALTAGTSAKEETPSSTRPVYVMWMVNAAAAQQPGPPFIVAAGGKWKVTVATKFATLLVEGVEVATVQLTENITSFRYSYKTL